MKTKTQARDRQIYEMRSSSLIYYDELSHRQSPSFGYGETGAAPLLDEVGALVEVPRESETKPA